MRGQRVLRGLRQEQIQPLGTGSTRTEPSRAPIQIKGRQRASFLAKLVGGARLERAELGRCTEDRRGEGSEDSDQQPWGSGKGRRGCCWPGQDG